MTLKKGALPKYGLLGIVERRDKIEQSFILVLGNRRCAGKNILILITQLYFFIVEFFCLNPAEEKRLVNWFKRNLYSYQLLQKFAKTPHAFSCVHMQTDRKGLPEPEIKESMT